MFKAVRMGALIAFTAGIVAGCADEGIVPPSATTPAPTSIGGGTQATAPTGEPTATSAPAVTGQPPVASSSESAPPVPADDGISGPGRCIDPSAPGVQEAVAGLGDGWVADQASADRPGDCGQLLWVRAVGGNSAGAPIHVLFFHDGTYLGTATSEPYAFTHVAGSSDTAVTVEYKWLVADEPFAAPQGGPAAITYTWTGSAVVMSEPLPPEVTRPHR
ncbi:LppP/LprE family lipoprotein [Nocardia sp. CA-290969]|uniref:LppP/LprE family lipoprotein n=1 Tax=Nocardia sp. CA-290969 TaxID=3239986 RepID=UPI003D90B31A